MMEPREPQRDRDARPASRPPARLAGMLGLAAVAVALAAGPALAWPPAAARTSTPGARLDQLPAAEPPGDGADQRRQRLLTVRRTAASGSAGLGYTAAAYCSASSAGWLPGRSGSGAGSGVRPPRKLPDGDHDLAFGVPFAEISQCRWHLTERNATIDHGGDLSSLA